MQLAHIGSGKVREIYAVDDERLLIVATDRISAFDVVLEDPIPDKGAVLTGLSRFWFDLLATPHHLLTTDPAAIPGLSAEERRALAGRAMLVRRAEVIPMECVVRGYLYGSAWKEYVTGGGPTTEHLPPGLKQAEKLADPIFTPASKAASGHDLNLTEADARALVGDDLYDELRRRSVALYQQGNEHAAAGGIILADTKFEFGMVDGELIVIDEVLTPDSSRYWPADAWVPGNPVPSYDKQFVRDWLEDQPWDKSPPAPRLPEEIVSGTRSRYVEAYELLTGAPFDRYLAEAGTA